MQRYFVPTEQLSSDSVRITGDDAHHLHHVLRAKPGVEVIVTDGNGREALASLKQLSKQEAIGDIVEWRESRGEPTVKVWIAQALPKGDKMETIIQKGTEIGASRFVPFVSERTIVQYDAKKESKRLERWERIAKEAAEQAHRGKVPTVDSPRSWRELLALIGEVKLALLCYEKTTEQNFRAMVQQLHTSSSDDGGSMNRASGGDILLIIGPEGGFTEKEAREAQEAGCRIISLGTRILRTETAAMVGLACIMYEYGEMGG